MKHSSALVLTVAVIWSPGCLGDHNLGNLGDPTGTTTTVGSEASGPRTEDHGAESTRGGGTADPTVGTDDTSGSSEGDGTQSSDGTGATGSTGDTGDTEGTGLRCETESLPELPAVLGVTVEIINDTEEIVYLADQTLGCTPFGVRRDEGWLSLSMGGLCGCECPAPSDIEIETMALAPGQSTMLSWDGRALAAFSRQTLCVEAPLPERCLSEGDGSAQPLDPGAVELVVPVFGPEPPVPTLGSYGPLDMCMGMSSFSVELELGTEDIIQDVALSTVVLR